MTGYDWLLWSLEPPLRHWCEQLADELDCLLWLTKRSDGFLQPLLMPVRRG